MKRLTKKYLMLLITVVALMTLTMFAASAACDHTLYPSYEGDVIDPTCTTEGYTEVVCGNCNEAIGRVPGSTKPATGHDYEWTMIANGAHYENNGECQTCRLNVKERDDNGDVIIYYAVTFKNPAAVKAYDTAIAYTKVVKERVGMDDAKVLGTVYVKSGEKAEIPSYLSVAGCEKDVNYGKYNFLGWFDEYVLIDAAPVANQAIEYDFDTMTITANMDVYAGFQGEDISYDVRYYDYNGKALAVSKAVPHGKASIYNLDTPTKESDVKFRYKFSYWAYEGKEVDLTAIYGDVAVRANYVSIAREYNVAYYYDAACTEPIINKEIAVIDSKVKYGESATNGLAIPQELLVKEADAQYIYAWTGKWVLANRQNYVISLQSFSVPDGTPDALDGSSEVRLIPQYVKSPRVYELKVTVIYPDDNNYHPEDVYIQVLYANGTAAGGQYATKIDDSTYEYTFLVNYSTSYTVAASATGYLGETVSNFVVGPSGAIVTMEKVAAHSCGCICHTFMKPIWVRILRLLHTLFGVEHVCCNDMFANIGPQLNYGPGKN
ncbi:MAG: hypothetical protein IJW86_05130 [Clostridia bacterium]|nr:hypothetical protein [Clostridia bacterium]